MLSALILVKADTVEDLNKLIKNETNIYEINGRIVPVRYTCRNKVVDIAICDVETEYSSVILEVYNEASLESYNSVIEDSNE